MSSLEIPAYPSISFDTHFANVPNLEETRFDPVRCADLLTHPGIGLEADMLDRIHIYVRPDYKLAYTRAERREAKKNNPEDYDDAASTRRLLTEGPFGNRGDILMTLVYDSGFGLNKLLCHEAVHARIMIEEE